MKIFKEIKLKHTVQFDKDQIPINARMHGVKCIHCGNQFLIKSCDDEFWCYRCKDYIMVEAICQ
jgi:DNA-directed RNA polymerase subunit RPC12/RpoP